MFSGCTVLFVSNLVGNPEDRFSLDAAHYFILEDKVAEQKAKKKLGLAGTETPIGPPSGDEAEVEQWNIDSEAPRGKDVHDETDEESNGGGDFKKNAEDPMEGECDSKGDNSEKTSDETENQKT